MPAFAILQQEIEETDDKQKKKYADWGQEQLPRVLLGIGDTLSALGRHADAADAYSRALEHFQSRLESEKQRPSDTNSKKVTIEQLKTHRKVAEATILVAEELLACPSGEDVVTTETQSMIVSAQERIEYAKGYYDKARDALQETVLVMGELAARSSNDGEWKQEKEDVCFLATMVMGVGETLAAIEEEHLDAASSPEPVKKKAKSH